MNQQPNEDSKVQKMHNADETVEDAVSYRVYCVPYADLDDSGKSVVDEAIAALDSHYKAKYEGVDQTSKYTSMISSFQCDFTLAIEGDKNIADIDITNEKVLRDIRLLEELEWSLRNGRLRILASLQPQSQKEEK